MKKKTLAMMLTLLLVVSIVPVAMAAGSCEHEHFVWVAQNDQTHIQQCSDCWMYVVEDSAKDHTFEDGKCVVCGYPAPGESLPKETEPETTEPEVCEHVAKPGSYVRNALESHTAICSKCGEEFTVHCVYGEDHKCVCGNTNPAYIPEETKPEETEPEATELEATEPEVTVPDKDDENLDDVPKTGDSGLAFVCAGMMVLAAISVAAYGINKKWIV